MVALVDGLDFEIAVNFDSFFFPLEIIMVRIVTEKSRVYLVGDTFAIKDRIKGMGGHWDADRKAWWVGKVKEKEAEALAEESASATTTTTVAASASTTTTKAKRTVSDDSRLAGKGKYKGRTYYILWMGTCKSGEEKARLTVLDGSIDFWVLLSEVEVVKTYSPREYRGRTEYTTLGSIRSFIERQKRDKAEGRPDATGHPRTGCSCGSREGMVQDTDCAQCRFDEEDN